MSSIKKKKTDIGGRCGLDRTGLSAGRQVGLYDAKSARKTQFHDVTSAFSHFRSPWTRPFSSMNARACRS